MIRQSELYACLFVEQFPIQALLRMRPSLRDCACVVMDADPPLRFVCACNDQASRLGIGLGMTQVEVETFPSATILPRSRVEEATAKATLLECAAMFSPRIEDQSNEREFICVVDIAGTEKLFGSPGQLAEALLERTKAIGIAAKITVSANFHTTLCLCRAKLKGPLVIVPAGKESERLAPLPLSVLQLPEQMAGTFKQWGIHTLGMLAALPEKSLVARVGQEGRHAFQMARGEHSHLFVPVEQAFTLEERVEFEAPVELLTSLLFVVDVALEQLTARACARALALAAVTIGLSLEGGTIHQRTVRPALPSNDRPLWIKLIHLDMEAHPPNAPIRALIVSAEPGKTSKLQLGLFSPPFPEPAQLDVTLARVRAIVGQNNVGRAELKDTHRPDSFDLVPFSVSSAPGRSNPQLSCATVRQIRPAERITVRLRQSRPISFYFREKDYAVEQAYGPWRSSGDWWNPSLWEFEQWDIIAVHNDEQLYCRLAHDLSLNVWQMVALYD